MRKLNLKTYVYILILGLSSYFAQANIVSIAQLDECERAISKSINIDNTKLMQTLQKLGLPTHSSIDDLRYDFFNFVEVSNDNDIAISLADLPDDIEYGFLVFLEAIGIIGDIYEPNSYPTDYGFQFRDFVNTEKIDSHPELSALAISRIWRTDPNTRSILSTFADKVEILRSRKPPNHLSDVENKLIKEIFRVFIKLNIYTSPIAIPEPIIAVIRSLDTLPHSEMFVISQWIKVVTVGYGHNLTNCFNWNTCLKSYKVEYESAYQEDKSKNNEDKMGRLWWLRTVRGIVRVEQEWYSRSISNLDSHHNVVETLRTNMPEKGLLARINLIDDEAKMRREGYSEDYIAGLEKGAKASLELAHILRSRQVNPRTTHVPELIPIAHTWINFIEERLLQSRFIDKEFRLNRLKLLKAEMQTLQAARQVTYLRWFNLGLRLSILVGPKGSIITLKNLPAFTPISNDIENEYVEYSIEHAYFPDVRRKYTTLHNQFPKHILIPTIHKLGLISLNVTAGTGVHLIGLDEEDLDFFFHDIDHASDKYIDNSQFTNAFRLRMRDLPRSEREGNEYMFFELTHEKPIEFPIQGEDILSIYNPLGAFFAPSRSFLLTKPVDTTGDFQLPEYHHVPYRLRTLSLGRETFLEMAISDFFKTITEVNAAINDPPQ